MSLKSAFDSLTLFVNFYLRPFFVLISVRPIFFKKVCTTKNPKQPQLFLCALCSQGLVVSLAQLGDRKFAKKIRAWGPPFKTYRLYNIVLDQCNHLTY